MKNVAKDVKEEIKRTLNWLQEQVGSLNNREISDFVKELLRNKKTRVIFFTGKGRSGLVAEQIAMRMVHLGYNARSLGESTAPPVKKKDVFIVISGSGTNRIEETKIAKELGARIVVLTSRPKSELAQVADVIITIKGKEKGRAEIPYREIRMRGEAILTLGTSFEDFCLIFLDSVLGYLAAITGQSEKDLSERHTPLQL